MSAERAATLSDLERLILGLFADGENTKSVAEKLEFKPAQVNEKLRIIYRKLNVHSITQSVFLVERAGLFKGIV